MDAMKLLIADGNEEFRRALAAELQGAYHVRCCGDGKEALSLLRSFVPDVLVLDLMLPELDASVCCNPPPVPDCVPWCW